MKKYIFIIIILLSACFANGQQANSHISGNSLNKILDLLEENELEKYPNDTIFRFLWIGYYGRSHNPISISISKSNKDIKLIYKFLTYCKKTKSDKLISDSVSLNLKDWIVFNEKLRETCFWELPLYENSAKVIMDGSIWFFEGKNLNKYRRIKRETESSEIYDLSIFLINKSKIKLKKKEFY